ncbi:aromatic ring-hydroxylating oxygenase subunit alpha [Paenibacillus aquistagni]|uniref:Phenylpropionate dioxygenase, large terminal subunit n=1 Tax=Paenibacillus aquistagni TaxID=1852522 RepID=A0A1X7KTY5_9BACL|nr:aromatic ring-hydroxylating dioxygenase subunit alpha [Paenibacillus aquistagni]SMG44357.1 Phenylpropionate dioxygenase, large terminal subunit [Paenibacillus aquistagni]
MIVNDAVLQQEWIVACLSSELTDKPKQVFIMGERVVVFRVGDEVHAFKDLCIHRGAALSLGCVKDGHLVCPYHAWEYNAEGDCTKIPQLPDNQAIPKKARAIVYGCEERYGMIWVNLSGNVETPRFSLPEFEDPSYRVVMWGPQHVEAKPPRIIENFLDVGHLAVVHEGYLGTSEHTEIGDYHMIHDEKGIRSEEIAIFQPDPDGSGQAKYVYYTYAIERPLTVKFTKRDQETGNLMTILLTVQPKDANTSIAYGIMLFNYDTGTSDEDTVKFQDMIFAQDKPVVENQKPEDLPLDLQTELSLKCDRVSIAYRQYLKKLGVQWGTA